MQKNVYQLLLSLSLFTILSVEAHGNLFNIPDNLDLIYGRDDRVEIDQYFDQSFVEKSNSIALRVSKRRLTVDRNDPNRILFPYIMLKNAMPNICKNERFIEQVSLGDCSGFLIGPKTLVTAGHCLYNQKECNDYNWVFGFKELTVDLVASQVYSCKKIIKQRYVYNSREVSDYAIIELDREVTNYVPLPRRKFGIALLSTPLVVIGHPLGLPMKAIDGGKISRMNDIERESKIESLILRSNYFTANLDTYGGSSGSPVFNKRNGNVEGILIQGAEDFIYNQENSCFESRKLSNSHLNTYERVMRINKVPGL